MLLLGLGDEERVTLNKIRKGVGAAVRFALKKGWKRVGIISPSTSNLEHDLVQVAVAEGALLANYDFAAFKGKPEPKHIDFIEIFSNGDDTRKSRRLLPQIEAGAEACHRVRDLVNTPAGDLFPETFAAEAVKLGKELGFGVEVMEPEALAAGHFNALLAVGQGSARTPRMVQLAYTPKEKAKKHVVLVGKGVCFDSGGLNAKDASGMENMKDDMTGAAIVLATVAALARLQAPVQVTGLIGLVENVPSGTAFKPGDVLRSRSGKTIEVLNTDAEGRLVLADLLDYAATFEADHVIDLATLTGAALVAMGDGVSTIFGTDQKLVDRLIDAGAGVGEHLWQLPLVEDYREQLRSHVADIKNITSGRWGGAITAALFLKDFVKQDSWAHVDLSSSWSASEKDYRTVGGTGDGPRWLLEWLLNG